MGLAASVVIAGRSDADIRGRASVQPAAVRIGQPARYVGSVIYMRGELTRPRWVPPDSAGGFSWGPLVARLGRGGAMDTLWLETTVQAFDLGTLVLPGVVFVDEGVAPPAVRRLPGTALRVVSVLTAADTNADLRGVRGPLAAPWWERVPWRWVIAAMALFAVIVWLLRGSRRRVAVGAPAPGGDTAPAALALARLAELRARGLPGQGAFGAHALELTSILRRFLEVTSTASRPGQTTTELSTWLAGSPLSAAEAEQLTRLMRGWDALKFARAGSSAVDAAYSEAAVEAFVRGRAAAESAAATASAAIAAGTPAGRQQPETA